PQLYAVYTVREVRRADELTGLCLQEILNPRALFGRNTGGAFVEPAFDIKYFRPAHAWSGPARPVEMWTKETGAEYLTAHTGGNAQRVAAEALSETFGGLPLAHQQAAAYCQQLGISLADYRGRLESADARLLASERDAAHEYRSRFTVAKTFA